MDMITNSCSSNLVTKLSIDHGKGKQSHIPMIYVNNLLKKVNMVILIKYFQTPYTGMASNLA